MKLVAEYLADAANFDKLAEAEGNSENKAALKKQAAAYRKLAADRAKQLGQPLPNIARDANGK